jgi:hypothetical protein
MLARIQMVAQRLGQNPWEGRQDFSGNAPPPLLYFKSLQNQIQKLREQVDPAIEDERKSSYYMLTLPTYLISLTSNHHLDLP